MNTLSPQIVKKLVKLSGSRPIASTVQAATVQMDAFTRDLLHKLIYIQAANKSQTITLDSIKFLHKICPNFRPLYGDPNPQMPLAPFKEYITNIAKEILPQIRFEKGSRAGIQELIEGFVIGC